MVTINPKSRPLYMGLQDAAKGIENSQFGQTYACHLLEGLSATFKRFQIRDTDQQIIAEAILRWRILKDAGMPRAHDKPSQRLFQFDDYFSSWLRRTH